MSTDARATSLKRLTDWVAFRVAIRLKPEVRRACWKDLRQESALCALLELRKTPDMSIGYLSKKCKWACWEYLARVEYRFVAHAAWRRPERVDLDEAPEPTSEPDAAEALHASGELVEIVRRALESLDPREREVMERRFGFGRHHEHTLAEVGEIINTCPERARHVEARALRNLRSLRRPATKANVRNGIPTALLSHWDRPFRGTNDIWATF